jgi:putative oxidoreductase
MLTRSEDAALLFGRVLIAALFLPAGYSKLMAFSSFATSLASKGVAYPDIVAGASST